MTAPMFFQDLFPGANGAAWDSTKWPTIGYSSGAGTTDIQSTQGRTVSPAVAWVGSYARFPVGYRLHNGEILYSIKFAQIAAEEYHGFWFRVTDFTAHASGKANNGYWVQCAALGSINVMKNVGGQTNNVVGGSSYTFSTTVKTWVKLQYVGTAIKCRAWQDGSSEPGTWNICDTTDSSFSNGQIYKNDQNGVNAVARTSYLDDVALSTTLDSPYLVLTGTMLNIGNTTSVTPTIPSTPASGDLVIMHFCSKENGVTWTPPANEGWSSIKRVVNGTSMVDEWYGKIWGIDTDDLTPTFTQSGSSTAGGGAVATVWRNSANATRPWTAVADAVADTDGTNHAAGTTTMTATASTKPNDASIQCCVIRSFGSGDDNAHGTNSEGILAYGGASYDESTSTTDYAMSMSWEPGVTADGATTGTATMVQTLVGADLYDECTIVLTIPAAAEPHDTTVTGSLGLTARAPRAHRAPTKAPGGVTARAARAHRAPTKAPGGLTARAPVKKNVRRAVVAELGTTARAPRLHRASVKAALGITARAPRLHRPAVKALLGITGTSIRTHRALVRALTGLTAVAPTGSPSLATEVVASLGLTARAPTSGPGLSTTVVASLGLGASAPVTVAIPQIESTEVVASFGLTVLAPTSAPSLATTVEAPAAIAAVAPVVKNAVVSVSCALGIGGAATGVEILTITTSATGQVGTTAVAPIVKGALASVSVSLAATASSSTAKGALSSSAADLGLTGTSVYVHGHLASGATALGITTTAEALHDAQPAVEAPIGLTATAEAIASLPPAATGFELEDATQLELEDGTPLLLESDGLVPTTSVNAPAGLSATAAAKKAVTVAVSCPLGLTARASTSGARTTSAVAPVAVSARSSAIERISIGVSASVAVTARASTSPLTIVTVEVVASVGISARADAKHTDHRPAVTGALGLTMVAPATKIIGKGARVYGSVGLFATVEVIGFIPTRPHGWGTLLRLSDPVPQPSLDQCPRDGVKLTKHELTGTLFCRSCGWKEHAVPLTPNLENLVARDEIKPKLVACPNCGQPVVTSPTGSLRCPFDGWDSETGMPLEV